jgi:hypothetical protein
MPLVITIDVFSGRRNPTILLRGEQERDALERLSPARRVGKDDRPSFPPGRLGYRGLVVEQTESPAAGLPQRFRLAGGVLTGPKLSHRVADEAFEDFVCGNTGPLRRLFPDSDLTVELIAELERFRRDWDEWRPPKHPVWPARERCRCAPLYEPDWWNDPSRQYENNCYNYSTDYRTDTFAQPGLAAGAMYTALDCPSVRAAALRDDLLDAPNANRCPREGHLVALVIWPGVDFHWYRKGRNGYWSHKPGSTPATNLDNSGNTISDPRTADRGGYTDFCTFMTVMHGHIKIQ